MNAKQAPSLFAHVFRHAFDIDATGEQLAMGSSIGGLWVTENGWPPLPVWSALDQINCEIYCVRFSDG